MREIENHGSLAHPHVRTRICLQATRPACVCSLPDIPRVLNASDWAAASPGDRLQEVSALTCLLSGASSPQAVGALCTDMRRCRCFVTGAPMALSPLPAATVVQQTTGHLFETRSAAAALGHIAHHLPVCLMRAVCRTEGSPWQLSWSMPLREVCTTWFNDVIKKQCALRPCGASTQFSGCDRGTQLTTTRCGCGQEAHERDRRALVLQAGTKCNILSAASACGNPSSVTEPQPGAC